MASTKDVNVGLSNLSIGNTPKLRNPNLYGLNNSYDNTQNLSSVLLDPTEEYAKNYTSNNTGGYTFSADGTNTSTNTGTEPGVWDRLVGAFNPNDKGTSLGGQVMSGIGTGVGAISAIASPILQYRNDKMNQKIAERNYQAQQDKEKYLRSRDAMADAKVAQMQSNYDRTA